MHYLNLYISFLKEIHTFDYIYTVVFSKKYIHLIITITTDIFNYFYVIPYFKRFNKILAFISIPIMLGVKLDVNWCNDKL